MMAEAEDIRSQDITQWLHAWSGGDPTALNELLPLVYDELRRQAARYLRRERRNHTLQTTALVHEAYLKLAEQTQIQWANRAQFFGIAAQMMRRILVDYARHRHRDKRGGSNEDVPLEEAATLVVSGGQNVDLLALDEALTRLAALDAEQARVVELRYFGGLSVEETAEVTGRSLATINRDWRSAKVWLHRELSTGNTA
jgi:RNA polymerase sigma factor (TIGR02999 family)